MGLIIVVLTSIILLLIVVILFIIARNKRIIRRSDVLGTFQHNLHSDVLGMSVDKRLNSNIKVNIKTYLYTEILIITLFIGNRWQWKTTNL